MDRKPSSPKAAPISAVRCPASRTCGSCAAPAAIPTTFPCRDRPTRCSCARRTPTPRIKRIDTAAARAMPGVIAVLTGADYVADGLKGALQRPNPAGAIDIKVRAFAPEKRPGAGRAAACRSRPTACAIRAKRWRWWWRKACLPRATPPKRSRSITRCCRRRPTCARRSAPSRSGRRRPDNVALDQDFGDAAAVQAAFAAADLVVEQTFRNQRIVNAQMEPRSGVASYDPAERFLHADLRQPGRPRAAHGAGGKLRTAAGEGPLRLPRRRRRLRPAQQSLSRAGGDPVGGQARRPAGEMDQRPLGILPHRLRRAAISSPPRGSRSRATAASPPTMSTTSAASAGRP